ncbi:MAG: hypothetical protein PHD19_06975 [Dechloromonas sp.]|nr:hypothetical protein [Dechloromonas sp.]
MTPTPRLLLLIALVLPGSGMAETAFGRLFHTPEERSELDRRRPREAPPTAVLNGEIRRSDGRILRRYDSSGWSEAIGEGADWPPLPAWASRNQARKEAAR